MKNVTEKSPEIRSPSKAKISYALQNKVNISSNEVCALSIYSQLWYLV